MLKVWTMTLSVSIAMASSLAAQNAAHPPAQGSSPAAGDAGKAAPAQQLSPGQQPPPAKFTVVGPDGTPLSPGLGLLTPCRAEGQEYEPMDEKMPCSPKSSDQNTPVRKTYTVPAGTKVLLQLRSAVNTASAKPGDGIYLASTFPVVVGNKVMIPAGVYVQGVVDRVARAGRVKGKAQLDMHFTSMIFPNGTVVEIPGLVNSLPGAKRQTVKDDGEGTIEQNGDKGRNAGKTAEIAIPTGGTVGSIGGLGAGHPIAGGVVGLAAGAATVGLVSLFTRGADVNIETGTQVEMVLQRPLLLEEENLSGTASGAAPVLVPAANQPKPLRKPHVLCPLGGLGCE
jgi:type IV secretion system protein VirB10